MIRACVIAVLLLVGGCIHPVPSTDNPYVGPQRDAEGNPLPRPSREEVQSCEP